MNARPSGKERWVVLEGIPGIASKDEIIIVKPDRGIIVSRYLPLSKYPDLMAYWNFLSPLALHKDDPMPAARPRRLRLRGAQSLKLMD